MCEHKDGMFWSSPIPPCQYLDSILRVKEREPVSIFMDVVEHKILAVFLKLGTVLSLSLSLFFLPSSPFPSFLSSPSGMLGHPADII